MAAQMGRLDFLSAILAAISLILVLGGVFAFLNLRALAKKTACEEAEKQAKQVAERIANDYLQKELPELRQEYKRLLQSLAADDDGRIADEIADAQDT